MAKCKECGRKGFFLRLNARGLCPECSEKALATPKSGQINFTTSGVAHRSPDIDIGHSDERLACQFFIDSLAERGKDISKFKIEHRSADYTSLVYDDLNDFIRIKMTDNVSWISIALSDDDRIAHENDPLFDLQKEKSRRHWRSSFRSINQLPLYLDMANNACVTHSIGYDRTLTDQEKKIADHLYDLYLNCGAQAEDMYALMVHR